MSTAPVMEQLGSALCSVGESPLWAPHEQALYWVDIEGRALHRWQAASARAQTWALAERPGCIALHALGGLVCALESSLVHLQVHDDGHVDLVTLASVEHPQPGMRFNDGRCDRSGRFWVGSMVMNMALAAPAGQIARLAGRALMRPLSDPLTVPNGLAFSPDGATMYWSDTFAHRIFAFDFDGDQGSLSNQRVFAQFAPKVTGQDLSAYGGRPDGAAVDVEGAYWVAMFEGQRLLRLGADGRLLQEVKLPVRCPTMPCFGGPDLKTLFITTARANRPAAELAEQLLAGRVLCLRVDVPGLPVNFAQP